MLTQRSTDAPSVASTAAAPDAVPPPGAYDVPVHSPVQPYKRAGMIEKANRFGTEHDPNKPGQQRTGRSPRPCSQTEARVIPADTFGLYNPDRFAADKENGVAALAKSTRSGVTAPPDREKHKREVRWLAQLPRVQPLRPPCSGRDQPARRRATSTHRRARKGTLKTERQTGQARTSESRLQKGQGRVHQGTRWTQKRDP